ncbi:DUF7003 family protein [Streptomyces sp. T028]|uniref:DUF7003 family protein n=1 Tax=Streptomyces sp. T028 TaxID=3394379 RepID=UPI003A83BFB2
MCRWVCCTATPRAGGVPLVVRGTRLTVTAGAGTPLEEVFRELVPTHRELLPADEAELSGEIPADLPLPLLLRLEEWNQPENFWDSAPSDHETFRMPAEVLDSGDPARYRPTLPPNTHWSNRPEAGTLQAPGRRLAGTPPGTPAWAVAAVFASVSAHG